MSVEHQYGAPVILKLAYIGEAHRTQPQEAPQTVTPEEFASKIKVDVEEALGNAAVKYGLYPLCHDVICGCPSCKRHAVKTQEYFDFAVQPSLEEARSWMGMLEKKWTNL